MLEIGWSELLILAVVTLLFVGPKELPVFLRTIGRYAGTLRRHASEFRAQFDAAMREAELDAMKEEMQKMQASVNAEVMSAERTLKEAGQATTLGPASQSVGAAAQPGSFTAAAAAAVFPTPTPAPTGQVYVRPNAEDNTTTDAGAQTSAADAQTSGVETSGMESAQDATTKGEADAPMVETPSSQASRAEPDRVTPNLHDTNLPDPASVPMPAPAKPGA